MRKENAFDLISLTTDFGSGTQGVGLMHAACIEICPRIRIIDLAHNVLEYSIIDGARQMESCLWLPTGIHICVVDPGVGSKRNVVAIRVGRGDILIGPDNGVLIPACLRLGGVDTSRIIANPKVCRAIISTTFHGRDIMAPAAAHLADGFPFEQLGPALDPRDLTEPPYREATSEGDTYIVKVIHTNKYGTAFVNLMGKAFEQWIQGTARVVVHFAGQKHLLQVAQTFSDVAPGTSLILLRRLWPSRASTQSSILRTTSASKGWGRDTTDNWRLIMSHSESKVTIETLRQMHINGDVITMVTAYDWPFARIMDAGGIDIVIVGDSLGMNTLGYKNTIPVTVEDILHHTKAVSRGCQRAMVLADMPYLSYEINDEEAVRVAGKFIKEGNADCVKIEGGSDMVGVIQAMHRAKIPVMGHLGITPHRIW